MFKWISTKGRFVLKIRSQSHPIELRKPSKRQAMRWFNLNSKFQNPCLRLPAVGRAGRQMSNECQSSKPKFLIFERSKKCQSMSIDVENVEGFLKKFKSWAMEKNP